MFLKDSFKSAAWARCTGGNLCNITAYKLTLERQYTKATQFDRIDVQQALQKNKYH
jgi:hypothetical protein